MARSKKIKVLSFAIFQGFLGTLLGLIAGICYSFGGLIIDVLVSMGWVTTSETPGLSYGTISFWCFDRYANHICYRRVYSGYRGGLTL